MTPENLAVVILGVVGVVLQLIFKYAPQVKQWYEAQANKGPIMLGFIVLASAGYFGLACSPYGAELGISLSCDQFGVFALLKALFIMATGNQLAYLYTRNTG